MARIPSTTAPEGAPLPERHPKAPAIGSKIPSHFGHCFGCGDLHPTGLHLVAFAGENLDITAQFTVTEDHQGAPGLAHGGLLSLAFDEALGKLMWLLRAPAVTGRLETDFIKPVPMDHFMNNAPKEYLEELAKTPELLAFVDPTFEVNP
ncbi:MAG: PaaI family thioesterase [Actinobacteria bacterium]|nr:PaaI family thioesterase [Actinomycetota bacterium]